MEEVKKFVENLIESNNEFIKRVDERHTTISLEFCNDALERVLEVIKKNE